MSRIGLVFGGPSPEHDISILTGLQVARLLASGPHEITSIYWTRSAEWREVPNELEGADFLDGVVPKAIFLTFQLPEGFVRRGRVRDKPLPLDCVINCCHGGPGEDGTLTAMLELAGIRVTGPSSEVSAWSMDKLATAGMVQIARLDRFGIESIPTVSLDATMSSIDLPSPWVIKPRFGGSSLGVEVGVEDLETALALARLGSSRSGAVVQPQLVGWSDLNVSVRVFPDFRVSAIERPVTGGSVYGFREKYLSGLGGLESARRELPAVLPPQVVDRIHSATASLAAVLGLTGLPRVDYLYDGVSRLALCEVNAIPGSLGLYLWAASGLDRCSVILDLVAEALSGKASKAHWSGFTDQAALRAASTVASKLA